MPALGEVRTDLLKIVSIPRAQKTFELVISGIFSAALNKFHALMSAEKIWGASQSVARPVPLESGLGQCRQRRS